MSLASSIEAIVFFHDQKRHIRVYYQHNDDTAIREASYRQDLGWFVRGDGVVTSKAKANSPIAVSRWTEATGVSQVCSRTATFNLDTQCDQPKQT